MPAAVSARPLECMGVSALVAWGWRGKANGAVPQRNEDPVGQVRTVPNAFERSLGFSLGMATCRSAGIALPCRNNALARPSRNRRVSNDDQVVLITALAMRHGESADFIG